MKAKSLVLCVAVVLSSAFARAESGAFNESQKMSAEQLNTYKLAIEYALENQNIICPEDNGSLYGYTWDVKMKNGVSGVDSGYLHQGQQPIIEFVDQSDNIRVAITTTSDQKQIASVTVQLIDRLSVNTGTIASPNMVPGYIVREQVQCGPGPSSSK